MAPSDEKATVLEGRVERITFHSENDHFTIARLLPAGQTRAVTVLGHMPAPSPGETLRLTGSWQTHSRYGDQFKVVAFEAVLPDDVDDIRQYLSGGRIKGLGPRLVDRIVRHFKDRALDVIDSDPMQLTQVPGIGTVMADRIARGWKDQHAARMLARFLQECGISAAYGARLIKAYGNDALSVLQTDPYQVAADIPRIGFTIADAVVRHSDLPIDETDRAAACLRHLMQAAAEQGHVYAELKELTESAGQRFELDVDAIDQAVTELTRAHEIVVESGAGPDAVFLTALHAAETEVAMRLQAQMQIERPARPLDDDQIAGAIFRKEAIALSEMQLEALTGALDQRVAIIAGGPGTGKTTLVRSLATVFDAAGLRCLLAAPTGRAARRLAEVADRPAVTLHRLLGYQLSEQRFCFDADRPLDTDALIVDEASMVDVELMAHLLRALPITARLILVGDMFQLPSVGPGNLMADLIRSETVATFMLETIFRQAVESPIVRHAHAVRNGRVPILEPAATRPSPGESFVFVEEGNPEKAVAKIVALCSRELDRLGDVDPIRDVQILTPVHKGVAGTINLNRLLQAQLNPGKQMLAGPNGRFRPGDKVMHLRNNYTKAVFNGDIGVIDRLAPEDDLLVVDYDGRHVTYDVAELDELGLAYAISVHKSQGSEYPVVIMPLLTQHYVMLQRNLLYTALTRARQQVILVGNPKAMAIAVANDRPAQRRSTLAQRLNPDLATYAPIDEPA